MPKIAFTAGRVTHFKCPPGKAQAFLWDATVPGLGLRTTSRGKPVFVFQAVHKGKDIRLTIGSPRAWSIEQSRVKARELQRQLDEGRDPREIKAAALTAAADKKAVAAANAMTVGSAWAAYLADRRDKWGARHYKDHIAKAAPGGVPAERGTRGRGTTVAGPLYSLMGLRLSALDAYVIENWAAAEGKTRPTSARLAWRLLKGFLSWCTENPQFSAALRGANPAKTKKTREALGKSAVKQDVLQREQLKEWFAAVRQLSNPAIAAYLQTLLLTGARPGEVLEMRWQDINARWKGLTIRDKVEGARVIPLTPYVQGLISALPRRNEWVFAGTPRGNGEVGAPLTSPNHPLARAGKIAGIEGLTLHGLRRSFKSLTEWLDIPAGVVAQIMGHKPSATAEKHYTVRPLDLLRVHHEKIEAWILEQAGIVFDAKAAGPLQPPAEAS